MSKTLILLAFLISSFSYAEVKVIYGKDDRSDVYNVRDAALAKLAKSTAAMINKGSLRQLDLFSVEVLAPTLQETGKCETEKFSQQLAAANCSGFLIGENLIATAGHCMDKQSDCDDYEWAFDFKVDYANQNKVILEKENVYSCKRIVAQVLDPVTNNDYAIVEVNRKVEGRDILKLRQSGKPKIGDEILVIGHPSGLPTKITSNAFVRKVNDIFFITNLDTYGGNSGSAVFNATTHEVEGILVRGAQDYKWDRNQGCEVSNVIGENEGRGEDVTLIRNILQFVL